AAKEAWFAVGSPPMEYLISVRVGFWPYQFGFGTRTISDWWVQVFIMNGPELTKFSASGKVGVSTHFFWIGLAPQRATMSRKYAAGWARVMVKVCSSRAAAASLARAASMSASVGAGLAPVILMRSAAPTTGSRNAW